MPGAFCCVDAYSFLEPKIMNKGSVFVQDWRKPRFLQVVKLSKMRRTLLKEIIFAEGVQAWKK